MPEGYAPGFGEDAMSMMAARTAAERAAFALPLFAPDTHVLDLGCGPGTITVDLAPTAHVTGIDTNPEQLARARAKAEKTRRSTVDFLAASVYALPFETSTIDAAFSHALFEHLKDPQAALAELRRVLRPGATLAISTSDWSKAKLRPRTANVEAALRGHYLLRRQAGGNPFAGRTIATEVATAGFTNITTRTRHREDMTYRELAAYIESRLATALNNPAPLPHRDQLASAARSAQTWLHSSDGSFTQSWTELTATR
ncbi:class I SAM-dependent methyltransferase [Amycolatopsis sp. NPDC059021]|uniref:class I SAM-dependent methyltransferase n=1 Tax=Amycolatopsis sp. NPDC059021 TaxID=3346704 RepID=UPI00366C7AF2